MILNVHTLRTKQLQVRSKTTSPVSFRFLFQNDINAADKKQYSSVVSELWSIFPFSLDIPKFLFKFVIHISFSQSGNLDISISIATWQNRSTDECLLIRSKALKQLRNGSLTEPSNST